MDTVYVTGHRNPDTDSIVAAMAYAALCNALGDREYVAARLGEVSDETQRVLERFGFEAPRRIYDMHTQLCDIDFDTPPVLFGGVTVGHAWMELQEHPETASLPVVNEAGSLLGMLSREDVASYNMELVSSAYLQPVPVFNLLSVLEGTLLCGGETADMVSGEVTVALPLERSELLFSQKDSIVLCGSQPDMIRRALETGVNCLILCQTEIPEELRAACTSTCIIATPFDAYRALRLIFQSVPVRCICKQKELTCFHLEDRVDDVREQLLKLHDHCYPILDADEQVVGVLARRHLLRPRRKRVVLVDHNEAAQSVPGLDETEILAIIDHHRLADIQTRNPIYVRNEPVGSTNTIIAGMFQERGLMPSAAMAGMMAAAIVSDTVMFKSPTCTLRDKQMAERMARIAGISLEMLGQVIFSASQESKSVLELLHGDYKEFHIAGHNLAVAQITCVSSEKLLARKQEFLKEMRAITKEKGYAMLLLMVTDVLLEGTQLIYIGDDEIISHAFGVQPKDSQVFLPGVMSRKKQVIPSLSVLWG